MQHNELVAEAARRVGAREILVGPVVEVIGRRADAGQTPRQITKWLVHHLGGAFAAAKLVDNPAAKLKFVEWVLANRETPTTKKGSA